MCDFLTSGWHAAVFSSSWNEQQSQFALAVWFCSNVTVQRLLLQVEHEDKGQRCPTWMWYVALKEPLSGHARPLLCIAFQTVLATAMNCFATHCRGQLETESIVQVFGFFRRFFFVEFHMCQLMNGLKLCGLHVHNPCFCSFFPPLPVLKVGMYNVVWAKTNRA